MYTGVQSLGQSQGKADRQIPDFYSVMWIRWHESIAERVAIGEMYHSTLRRPIQGKAVWEDIVLG